MEPEVASGIAHTPDILSLLMDSPDTTTSTGITATVTHSNEAGAEGTVYQPFSAVNPDNEWISENEQKACIMLSNLFLDIDQDDEIHLAWIARRLQPLNLAPSDLDRLLRYDVFPVVCYNLLMVAGEWASFDGAWLLDWINMRRKWTSWRWATAPANGLLWLQLSAAVVPLLEKIKEKLSNSEVGDAADNDD
jgi:hypothetical protein